MGLNYLTLDRSATTLSGGESQRIRLVTQIGSKLTGVLYVLDEPSIGLHRYNRETLEIKCRGKNIAQVMDMTVNQSLKFFDKIAAIKTKLQTLVDVGLGYIKIGQAATTAWMTW